MRVGVERIELRGGRVLLHPVARAPLQLIPTFDFQYVSVDGFTPVSAAYVSALSPLRR